MGVRLMRTSLNWPLRMLVLFEPDWVLALRLLYLGLCSENAPEMTVQVQNSKNMEHIPESRTARRSPGGDVSNVEPRFLKPQALLVLDKRKEDSILWLHYSSWLRLLKEE